MNPLIHYNTPETDKLLQEIASPIKAAAHIGNLAARIKADNNAIDLLIDHARNLEREAAYWEERALYILTVTQNK